MINKITFSTYKCFENGISIEAPKLVNLIIGKNNSGKSSFLDYMVLFYTRKSSKLKNCKCDIECVIEKEMLPYLSLIRASNNYYGVLPNKEVLLNKKIVLTGTNGGGYINYAFNINKNNGIVPSNYNVSLLNIESVISLVTKKYEGVFKIGAERDIRPEKKNNEATVLTNGDGIVAKMLYNKSNTNGKRRLISNILKDLNEILRGECSFSELDVLENNDGTYEITLTNSEGEEIPLSEMGSGIKTIIFVSYVLNQRQISKNNSILLFEELENNLHPEVQRRLFNKVYEFAIKNECPVFITSHSNVAINTLFGKENTMVYHVFKEDENKSNVKTVLTASNKKDILDDLGIKANDIFQANGIIWVEGPSDRVYLNKWIKLIDPELKENVDYTFLYYGGRLLSHYSANSGRDDFIDVLLTNRNSAVVMDSDIKEEGSEINSTKKRIVDEFAKEKCFAWVTKGREIENYIHKDSINRKYPNANKDSIGVYDDFKDYIENLEPSFENSKVEFAKSLEFEKSDLDILDLNEKILELVSTIKKWNQ